MNQNTPPNTVNMTAEILTTASRMFGRDSKISVCDGFPRTDGKNVWIPGIRRMMSYSQLEILRGYFIHETAHIRYKSLDTNVMLQLRRDAVKVNGLPGICGSWLHSFYNVTEDARIEAKAIIRNPGAAGPLSAIKAKAKEDNNNAMPQMAIQDQCGHALLWHLQTGLDGIDYLPEGRKIIEGMNLDFLIGFSDKIRHGKASAMDAEKAAVQFVTALNDHLPALPVADPPEGTTGGDPDGDPDGDPMKPGDFDGDSEIRDEKPDDFAADFDPNEVHDTLPSTYEEEICGLRGPRKDSIRLNSDVVCKPTPLKGRTAGIPMGTEYNALHVDAMRLTNALRIALRCDAKVNWTSPQESGHRIDRRRLGGVASGLSVRAFNRKKVDAATQTHVSILMDTSGSMHGDEQKASWATYMIADACETIGVPCGITEFNSRATVCKDPGVRITPATGRVAKATMFTNMLPCILQAAEWDLQYPRHRHVCFIISDGDTSQGGACEDMIESMGNTGTTFIGIKVNGYMSVEVANAICNTGGTIIDANSEGSMAATMDRALRSI